MKNLSFGSSIYDLKNALLDVLPDEEDTNQDEFIEKSKKFSKEVEHRWGILKDNCAVGRSDIDIVSSELVLEHIKDYILSSGETHTIKEFVEKAFVAAEIYGGWVELEGYPHETKFFNNPFWLTDC